MKIGLLIVCFFIIVKVIIPSTTEQLNKIAKQNTIRNVDILEKMRKPEAKFAKDYIKNKSKKINENEILLAEIKKNREELTKIQNQLNSQRIVMNDQNNNLKKVKQFNHWQGISRMMQSFGLN